MLINLNDMNEKCRPTYTDTAVFEACANEVELIDLKSLVGDETYLDIVGRQYEEELTILMDGGKFTDNRGEIRFFGGLKKALCYLTYARILRASTLAPTRFGVTEKSDNYSVRAELEERQRVANDIDEIGNVLINECVSYMRNSGLFKNLPGAMKMRKQGTKFYVIG